MGSRLQIRRGRDHRHNPAADRDRRPAAGGKTGRRPLRATDLNGFSAAAAEALKARAIFDGDFIRIEPLATRIPNQ